MPVLLGFNSKQNRTDQKDKKYVMLSACGRLFCLWEIDACAIFTNSLHIYCSWGPPILLSTKMTFGSNPILKKELAHKDYFSMQNQSSSTYDFLQMRNVFYTFVTLSWTELGNLLIKCSLYLLLNDHPVESLTNLMTRTTGMQES